MLILHKSTVKPFTMRGMSVFGFCCRFICCFTPSVPYFLCSAVSEQCFGIERIFYNTKLPLLFVLHLFAEAVLFYVPKVLCFVLTPYISGGIIQLQKHRSFFIVTPHAEAGGNLTRRLLFRFVRFAAGKLSKKRTVLLRAVLKKQPALSMLKSD